MRKIALLLLISFILVSCGGKKEVKQVSQESKTSVEAFAVAETIKNAFMKNDRLTIQANSTDSGFRDITANKKGFDSVDITLTPRWVEIDDKEMRVNISWKSAWTRAGKKTEERGMAVFVMAGSPLKVTKILLTNPFIYPEQ